MPTPKQHYKKALYNEKFFHDVKSIYTDWAVTGIFYAALHLIDAFLSSKGIHPKDHKDRANYAGRIKELKLIYSYYRYLYDHSINARYTMTKISTINAEQIYKDYFLPIKNDIVKILNYSEK